MSNTNLSDWYWKDDEGRIYASARQAIVADDDEEYLAFLVNNGFVTRWPEDDEGAQTDEALEAVIEPHGLALWPDPDPLATAKTNARTAIIARANAFTVPILSKYPEAERAGWDKREAEARAVIAAGDKAAAIAATSVIKALATAWGETTAATVARAEAIAAKADEFAAISAAVEIMRDTALTAIEAVEDGADMPATLEALKVQATAMAAQYGLS